MKIRLMSDLHLEFADYNVEPMVHDHETVLVLAGDIHVGLRAKTWITKLASRFKAIVYVLGNHEFYHGDIVDVVNKWLVPKSLPDNVFVLHNEVKHIGNVAFIGTPLWTDFDFNNLCEMSAAAYSISDFYHVTYANQKLTPDIHVALNKDARKFIEYAIRHTSPKRVVVSHWMPTFKAVSPRFLGASLNSFFAANMDDLIPKVDAWLFGHTHDSVDMMCGDTRLVCNPRGYAGHELNDYFDHYKVIEV